MTANFIYYSSINKHYTYVNNSVKNHPELAKELFVVQHKYDGSNFQVLFSKNEPVKFASRNEMLNEEKKFFGWKNIIPRVEADVLKKVQNFLDKSDLKTINLFGELYGSAVNKRIMYEENSVLNLKLFDVYFNGIVQSPKFFYEWTEKLEIPKVFLVETMTDEPVTLQAALEFDTESVKTKCGDIIEGNLCSLFNIIFL